MQQSEDLSSVLSFKDPNFLALLSLQTLQKPPWELGDYLPHEVPEFHSPTNYYHQNPSLERINEAISSQELQLNPQRKRRNNNNLVAASVSREKRKRKRTKPTKNTEEMESQRMTHITVERNRRRQMNVYLSSLRSLIPSSYILRVYITYKASAFINISVLTSVLFFFFSIGRPSVNSRRSYRLREAPRAAVAITRSAKGYSTN